MKNIITVLPHQIEHHLNNLWRTKEFKFLQKNHPFFKKFTQQLQKAPVYFFDNKNEKGKYHLSSHMRLIANRLYDDNYMHDLYYFHELLHCAEFEAQKQINYQQWKNKLNENELFASVVSEVLIYYMMPQLIGKTFDPLWAEIFYKDDSNFYHKKDDYGFFIHDDEKPHYNPMNFKNIHTWPQSIQRIHKRRNELRCISETNDVQLQAEKSIVLYNKPREKWLEAWRPHYKKINSLLFNLTQKTIDEKTYITIMLDNCDEHGRAFFPKTHL